MLKAFRLESFETIHEKKTKIESKEENGNSPVSVNDI